MRYEGQGHELEVEFPARTLVDGDHQTLRQAFEERYEAVYGRKVENADAEVLTWSVLVSAPSPRPALAQGIGESHVAKPTSTRPVFDAQQFELLDYGIHWRDNLVPGAVIHGPAIIEEEETSTVVPAAMQASILASGAILCEDLHLKSHQISAQAAVEEKENA